MTKLLNAIRDVVKIEADGITSLLPKKEKKVSVIKQVISNPDNFEFSGKVTNGEIVIKIKPNTEES